MRKICFLILCLSLSIYSFAKPINILVFHDTNNNGIFDAEDKGLPNTLVSSLSEIKQTNENGLAMLSLDKKDIAFVIKPAGYQSPINEFMNPEFYRICYQKSSSKNLKYEGVSANNIADTIYFPLIKQTEKPSHQGHMIGDIQTPTYNHVKYFRQKIMPDLIMSTTDFGVCLGDITDNDLNLYDDIKNALSTSNMPLYMVFGNHDVNYLSKNNKNKSETFRRQFGPDYYAFNYGKNHCIVLNNIDYDGWNKSKNKKGDYFGGFNKKQMEWLKQDLSFVQENKRIVIFTHIPLLKTFTDSTQLVELFELLANRKDILAISGHTHTNINWDFDDESLWNHEGKFKGHAAGASCGAWWVTPMGIDSLPDATCNDGTPAGTFIYNFNEQSYSRDFIAGANYATKQLRISEPFTEISIDSLSKKAIYVNVFDGDDHTKATFQIDNSKRYEMEKVIEFDPFIVRNQYQRRTYDDWTPWLAESDHLWKASYPKDLSIGMHSIKAHCTLANGKNYTTAVIFEITK